MPIINLPWTSAQYLSSPPIHSFCSSGVQSLGFAKLNSIVVAL